MHARMHGRGSQTTIRVKTVSTCMAGDVESCLVTEVISARESGRDGKAPLICGVDKEVDPERPLPPTTGKTRPKSDGRACTDPRKAGSSRWRDASDRLIRSPPTAVGRGGPGMGPGGGECDAPRAPIMDQREVRPPSCVGD